MSGLRAIRRRLERTEPIRWNVLPQELPGSGVGDYRRIWYGCTMQMAAVRQIFGLRAMKYRRGAYRIPGLPAAYDTDEEKGETLVITMRETASAVKVKLYYGVFEK